MTTMNTGAASLSDAVKTALSALEAIAAEMTVGDRFTNAGQHLLDALPVCRAALSTPQADAAIAAGGAQEPTDEIPFWNEGDNVLVPRGLLGAACSAIDKKRDAPKTLAALRAITSAAPLPREAETVPEGFALVPLKPNDAMQAAGAQAVRMDTTVINKIWTANAVFRAMVEAAASNGEQ